MNFRRLALTGLAAALGFVPVARADLTREEARPIMYQAVVDMAGGATMSQEIWGYPGPDDMFILDVYTNDDMSTPELLVPNVGFDYMATNGDEPENRIYFKIPWGQEPWAKYFNLPSLPDSAAVYNATQDSLRTVIQPSAIEDQNNTQRNLKLSQNTPNPFGAFTTIRLSVQEIQHRSLGVYDVSGRLVKTLIEGPISQGDYVIKWDGTNDDGKLVANGTYFYGVGRAEPTRRRMILTK